MPVTRWGNTTLSPLLPINRAGLQSSPAIADNGGTEFGVAYIENSSITVRFFDELGQATAARAAATVTDGIYGTSLGSTAAVSNVQMSAGGVGLGYGVVWEEFDANNLSSQSLARLRYIGPGSVLGGEIELSQSTNGLNQHAAAIAGYSLDGANGRPDTEGFSVAWVETASTDAHAAGSVFLQRFSAPLDARRNPISAPTAAGLDGRISANPADDHQELITADGRDPSVAVFPESTNETAVAWVDSANHVHLRIYNVDGSLNTGDRPGEVIQAVGADPANLGTTSNHGMVHMQALAAGGFVVAWVADAGAGNLVLMAQVYTPGVAPGTFSTPGAQLLADVADTITDFSLAALPDSGGFAASWTALDSGSQAVYARNFTSGGAAAGAESVFHANHNATDVAIAGLVGDRFVAVYQDDSIIGDPGNIGAQIFDTRTTPTGGLITLGGPGLTLIGDPAGGGGAANGLPDTLVGTIGNDIIDGRLRDDIMDGGLGDDTIFAGAGNDAIDGGGGNDTAVFTGRFTMDNNAANDDYSITYEGNGIFTVTDLRTGAVSNGVDLIRNVENFVFQGSGTSFTSAQLSALSPNVTPTAWGLTNEDLNNAPSPNRVPDVDGFTVNQGTVNQLGVQSHPVIADSIGEFVGILWESDATGSGVTHIRGQFLDVLAQPDTGTPMPFPIDVSDGIGIESNAAIVSGGGNGGWGIAFEERDNASDLTHTIRTNFVGVGAVTGAEQSVLNEGPNVDQHNASLSGSFLDRTLGDPVGGSALPKGMSDGYNVTWVSTHLDGAGVATDVAGDARYGHIMFQRYEVPLDSLGNVTAPVAGGIDGIHGLDNAYGSMDDAVWVGDEDHNGVGGAIGRNPITVGLHGFETAIVWIEKDPSNPGQERVAGQIYDDLGQVIPTPEFENISGAFAVAPGTTVQMVQAGAVNLGIVWITLDATSPSGYTVMGTMFSPTGSGLNGQGFGFAAPPAPFVLEQLPLGFNPATADFHASGISGEDSEDVVISWTLNDDMQGRHIRTTLDPVTGIAISMAPEGDAITINASTAGVQNQGGVAGLLSDRFIAVYHDNSGITGGSDDIVARVFDVRSPGQTLEGDLIRNGVIQARADIIVGTNGNDIITGDLQDNIGNTDQLYGGLGDDILRGGPDHSAGARVEILDGGEGTDTAVYTGKVTDYSISINGDGSITIIDLRPLQSANGTPLQNDGTDFLFSIEKLQFLGQPGGPVTINLDFVATPNALDAAFNGTPRAWSLTDASVFKTMLIGTDPAGAPGGQPGTQTQISVAGLQNDAAMSWVSDGTSIYAIRYDTLGGPDALFSAVPVKLNDASPGSLVADPFTSMAGGLGFITAWESTTAGATSIHMAFGSIGTNTVFDIAAGVPGGGLATEQGGIVGDNPATAEDTVVGSNVSGQIAVDPVTQGYEIVDVNNDTLEFGFHVAYVMKTSAADSVGVIQLARYDIPIYDADPVTGALLRDANGNLIPSADFGRGAETQPIAIGQDGYRGINPDTLANDDAQAQVIGVGRDPSMGGLHDGQMVLAYIDASNTVKLQVFAPHTDEAADREEHAGVGGQDIVVAGHTTFDALTLPFSSSLGTVAAGQKVYVAAEQNGSFGVFWAAAGATPGTVDIKGMVFTASGANNWAPSAVMTFETGLPAGAEFQVSNTGTDVFGLEDGFLINWQTGGAIFEQRFNLTGALVGTQVRVDDPTGGAHTGLSTSQTEDGRIIVGYQNAAGDVVGQYLDTRQAGIDIIGPRLGAPRDVLVGTVGNDNMTGGQLADEIYGGLGNDLLSGGSGADILVGGAGNDQLIGALGQDQLLGGDGDDFLWTGFSGPIDAKVDRDLITGLTAAGVSAALIATDTGADIVSGGAGIDTLSMRGEFGDFNINLGTGIVTSDRDQNGSFVLEDVIGQIVDDGAGGTIFQFINDIENAEGGFGNDTLIGNAGNNTFFSSAGRDTINGAGGTDTLVISGNRNAFTVTFDNATQTFTITETSPAPGTTPRVMIVQNVEFFTFNDVGTITAQQLQGSQLIANNDSMTMNEDTVSAPFDVRANDTGATIVTAINGIGIASGIPVTLAQGVVSMTAAGLLQFTPNADFAGTVTFSYEVINGLGSARNANVTITVNNVEDAPRDIVFNANAALNTLPLPENTATGATVATMTTVDPDAGEIFTYSLANTFGGRFAISGNKIVVANGALNFEDAANRTFALQVTVSDGHPGGTRTETFTINLTNVNEAPTDILFGGVTAPAQIAIAETGGTVTTLTSTDQDVGDTATYTLVNSADGRFAISGNQIIVADAALTDFEDPTNPGHTYQVQVEARDAGGQVRIETLTIAATDVAETRIAGATTGDNTLNGTAGNDILDGLAGKDTMNGGAGNDTYFVDNSGDKITENANAGTDTVYVSNALNSYTLGNNLENLIYTGTGASTLRGNALNNTIAGGSGADQIQGDDGNDHLVGNAGNDTITGGNGNDRMYGGAGNDSIDGGAGDDYIEGGAGNDTLIGGAGNDKFMFAAGSGNDTIQQFGDAAGNQDIIQFSSAQFHDFADVQSHMAQVGANVVITATDGSTLTLAGINISTLDATDFAFFGG